MHAHVLAGARARAHTTRGRDIRVRLSRSDRSARGCARYSVTCASTVYPSMESFAWAVSLMQKFPAGNLNRRRLSVARLYVADKWWWSGEIYWRSSDCELITAPVIAKSTRIACFWPENNRRTSCVENDSSWIRWNIFAIFVLRFILR